MRSLSSIGAEPLILLEKNESSNVVFVVAAYGEALHLYRRSLRFLSENESSNVVVVVAAYGEALHLYRRSLR